MHFTRQIQDMDLRLLRVFKAVVESKGFTAAEIELNVSRSAISSSMLDLETRLGLKLCERGRSGFSLTDPGKQIYQHVLQLFDSMEMFRSQVNAIHSSLTGELNIGITDNLITMQHMRIVHSLRRLKEAAPDVTINVTMMPPNEIEKGVLNGQLHIGMVPIIRDCPGLDYQPLYEEHASLYCGEHHPLFTIPEEQLTPELILEHDTVAPAHALPDYIQKIYDQHKITATVSDREGVAFLLMTGCFIGFLPTHYAINWEQASSFRSLRPETFSYSVQYMAITKSGKKDNLVLNSYMQSLQSTNE
ncbi:LysR family transcriptional regulator [Amphritea opalescens]|uniref:LysR family transcriptional regulator n=2 Tax=Amphritea opalescens TaxID=2490544 RepID=A0A430KMG0_9GAMM|nr:LysR family transcriptional regulator [Amphritea opalescens]